MKADPTLLAAALAAEIPLAGISQREVARRVGLTHAAVGHALRHGRPLETLIRIAAAIGLEVTLQLRWESNRRRAKVRAEDAAAIRRMRGQVSAGELAQTYGVCRRTIYNIQRQQHAYRRKQPVPMGTFAAPLTTPRHGRKETE